VIGKRITELRNERGLTQQTVAEGIGVSRATYAHYEIDRREPDHKMLRKIANFFDVSTDYLLGLTDLPKPYLLSGNSPLSKLVHDTIKAEGFTPTELTEVNPEIARFMQDNKIVKAKAKLDLIEKSGLSVEALEKLVALINQIKNEQSED